MAAKKSLYSVSEKRFLNKKGIPTSPVLDYELPFWKQKIITIIYILILLPFYGMGLFVWWGGKFEWKKYKRYKKTLQKITNDGMSVNKFREFYMDNKRFDFKGCYLLINKNENKTYTGQSINVLKRVIAHIDGRGNSKIYGDMNCFNHSFRIKTFEYEKSPFRTLNKMERHYINKYNSYKYGYNKTRGNH